MDERRILRHGGIMLALGVLLSLTAGVSAQSAATAQAPGAQTTQPPASAAPVKGGGADDLSRQATDPTASLMAFNFINDVQTSYHGVDDSGFEFRFQPVVPFRAFRTPNILRIVVPFQASGPGNEGLKSVSIFDLVILPRKWGRVGVGPVMSLAESAGDAPAKFAVGPAVGAVKAASKRFSYGAFNQNLFGTDTAITQLQPVVAYQLGHGWALSAGDLQYIYDWERGGWVSIPLGFQMGVVRPLAGQPFRFSVNPQWNVKDITGTSKGKVVFTITLLAPVK